jgi:hypothetical protein
MKAHSEAQRILGETLSMWRINERMHSAHAEPWPGYLVFLRARIANVENTLALILSAAPPAAIVDDNGERLPPQRSGDRQDAKVVPDSGQPDAQKKDDFSL